MTSRLEVAAAPINLEIPQHNMEILTPKTYGLAGRLLAASVATSTELPQILDPNADIQSTPIYSSLITKLEAPGATRNISQITQALSTQERAAAWDGTPDLSAALTEWARGFTTYAKNTTKEGRRNAISGLAEKDATSFTEADSLALYDKFCKDNASDTSTFVNATIGRLKDAATGKVDITRLNAELADIEWLASRFFGVETAKAVGELIKVEAELENNKENTINVLLKDAATSRVDSFYPEEEDMLAKLFGRPIATPVTTPPAPAPEPTPAATPQLPPTPAAWTAPAPSGTSPATSPLPRAPWEAAPAPEQPITEAQIQEARESEVGREVEKYLGELKAILERAHNNEALEDDARLRDLLLDELDVRVGNQESVLNALEQINRLYKHLSEGRLTPAYHANREEFLNQHPDFKSLDEDARQEEAKLYIAAYTNSPSTPVEPVADGAPTAPEPDPINGNIVAQVLSPDNKTPDGQSYIIPKELLTHEGLDFSQTALNPQLQELIRLLSENSRNPFSPKEVRLGQSFSAEELQEADPQWQGLDLRILVEKRFDANDIISLSASMKHSSVPEATQQSSIRQRYKDLEAYLEKTLGKEVRLGGSIDRDYNPLSIDISWIGDKIQDILVLRLSPDGMSISLTMDNPGREASSVRDDLVGNTGEIALKRFFSIFSSLTPLMHEPVFTEPAPGGAQPAEAVATTTPASAEPTGTPESEVDIDEPGVAPLERIRERLAEEATANNVDETIPLAFSTQEELQAQLLSGLGSHQEGQYRAFRMGAEHLPDYLHAALGDKMLKEGRMEYRDNTIIFRDLEVKRGPIPFSIFPVKLDVSISNDDKGMIEAKVLNGDIAVAHEYPVQDLRDLSAIITQGINGLIQERYPQMEVGRLELKTKEGEDKPYLEVGIIPTPQVPIATEQPQVIQSGPEADRDQQEQARSPFSWATDGSFLGHQEGQEDN